MTPACAVLDAAGVTYTMHPYEADSSAESFGAEAATLLGLEPSIVYKTLMAELDDGELVVAIVPVAGSLDLKALARVAGAKRAHMADVAAAERSSGYVAGGISPFGQRNQRRTFLDSTTSGQQQIYVSGGKRGLDIGLFPDDLIAVVGAVVAPISKLG